MTKLRKTLSSLSDTDIEKITSMLNGDKKSATKALKAFYHR
jgi:hypothetical protein